ncbi:hypothetical protein O3P69_019527 [Scylla paramamosain]|uniref:non-specific serine/threonine protein kinase n=1 Tax=Scylla paramamosain TaxID=85552 RepID=A0AAW0SWW4_SCYPA
MEVNLLRELNHPHIVRFLHHIVDRRTTTLYILMEYCPGGDLRQLVNKCKKTGSFLPEDFIWKVLKQICEALKTCHTFRRTTTTTTTTTTTARSKVILHRDIKPANEVVEGQEYNDKSDMWSLGCLIYELCALQPPFMAATHAHLAAKIKEARYPPIPVHYTLELRELLDELLTPQYFMRPSALMLLHHPRDMSGRREVKGCQGFERQDSNSRVKKEPDFQSKQEQDSHARMDSRIHSKIQDFRSIRDYKTQPKTHQDLNDVNQNEKTPTFDLTSDLDPQMTPQLHPRPDCDSDLDTTLSAGLDETEEVTTARPDPAVLRNPFLEMRSGHGKQVTFSGVENGCVFKNNTLDNPKSRKKMGCVFVLDSGQVMQDVKDARSKVRSECEVRGTECEEVAEIRLKSTRGAHAQPTPSSLLNIKAGDAEIGQISAILHTRPDLTTSQVLESEPPPGPPWNALGTPLERP